MLMRNENKLNEKKASAWNGCADKRQKNGMDFERSIMYLEVGDEHFWKRLCIDPMIRAAN